MSRKIDNLIREIELLENEIENQTQVVCKLLDANREVWRQRYYAYQTLAEINDIITNSIVKITQDEDLSQKFREKIKLLISELTIGKISNKDEICHYTANRKTYLPPYPAVRGILYKATTECGHVFRSESRDESNYNGFIERLVDSFKYCPVCGKRVKVEKTEN